MVQTNRKVENTLSVDQDKVVRSIERDHLGKLPRSINVLGTEYEILYLPESAIKFDDDEIVGSLDRFDKEIRISIDVYNKAKPAGARRARKELNEILRHEIMHAFFAESGLGDECDFTKDEILVDWIAMKLPQIIDVMEDANIIEGRGAQK